MKKVDLLVIHAVQLVTCASGNQPKRGTSMGNVGIIENGAIAVENGVIVATGETDELLATFTANTLINASGKVVIPGLVDCHTHVPYAGNRYDEFEMRVQGHSYVDIMNAGGGIVRTVRQTRETPLEKLTTLVQQRLQAMMQFGTTTAELKTGYGLSTSAESKLMEVICNVLNRQPVRVIPTYLGAHTIPAESPDADTYMNNIIVDSLPSAKAICDRHNTQFFVDIFVEDGVFTVEHMQHYFEVSRRHDIPLKAHLDQFEHLGGVPVAVKMDATSVDHLEVTPADELDILAKSNTVGVMLPGVNFNLGVCQYGNARHLIDADGILALATDYNPGSSPTMNLPLIMAIACRFQKLLPAEALNACTINAAAALKLEKQIGSLEVGKLADFLILNTQDYRAIIVEFGRNFVEQVIVGGQQVWTQSS